MNGDIKEWMDISTYRLAQLRKCLNEDDILNAIRHMQHLRESTNEIQNLLLQGK